MKDKGYEETIVLIRDIRYLIRLFNYYQTFKLFITKAKAPEKSKKTVKEANVRKKQ